MYTMERSAKAAILTLLLCWFYVSQLDTVSCSRILAQNEDEESRVGVASSHQLARCKEGSSSDCGGEFQAEKLHSVPSGPNPVGNSLPGKLLITRRSPPPFPEGIPHP